MDLTPAAGWALSVAVSAIAMLVAAVAHRLPPSPQKLTTWAAAVTLAVVALVLIAAAPVSIPDPAPGDCAPLDEYRIVCRVDALVPGPVPGRESS